MNPHLPSGRNLLLYDDRCPVCRAAARLVERFDRDERFEFVGFAEARDRRLDRRLRSPAFESSFHLVAGQVWTSGAEAVPLVLARLPAGRPLVRLLKRIPVSRRLNQTLYDWIARHRGTLGCARAAPSMFCAESDIAEPQRRLP